MLFNCGAGEGSWESLGLQGDPTSPFSRRSALNIHWKDWCWSWISNSLATSCEELPRLKRPWYWKRLKAGGKGDDRGWNGWMTSQTRWTWVWASSESWWWTRKPGIRWRCFKESNTTVDWTELKIQFYWITTLLLVVAQLQSHVWLLLRHGLQHARLPCHSLSHSSLGFMSIESVMPLLVEHYIFVCWFVVNCTSLWEIYIFQKFFLW